MGRRVKGRVLQVLEDDDLGDAPLFESAGEISYIAVSREDPDEGFLGKLPPRATEGDIRKKWGGGTFSLTARNATGKHVKGGTRVVQIAGDPMFQSLAAEKKWKRQQGLEDAPAAAKSEKDTKRGDLTMQDLLIIMDRRSDESRREREEARAEAQRLADQRAREAQEHHQRQLELVRLDNERRERELKAEAERQEKQLAAERSRLREEAAAERERQREFTATMLQLVATKRGGGGDSLEAFTKGIELARDLAGGGEEKDPLNTLVENIPAVVSHLQAQEAARQAGPAGLPAPAPTVPNGKAVPRVVLHGELATKVARTAQKLKARGIDPEQAFAQLLDQVEAAEAEAGAAQDAAPPPEQKKKPARKAH